MKKKEITYNDVAGNDGIYRMDRRTFVKVTGTALGALALGAGLSRVIEPVSAAPPPPVPAPTLPGKNIMKYMDQLVIPPVYTPTFVTDPVTGAVIRHDYTVDVTAFTQQVLPAPNPVTQVWGYGGAAGGTAHFANAPGATFVATRGIPVQVRYQNKLTYNLSHMFAVDPTLHWANPNNFPMPMPPVAAPLFPPGYPQAQSPVPIIPHLHGGEVHSTSDGHPDAWFTDLDPAGTAIHGPAYNTLPGAASNEVLFEYPNQQLPTTLWYHDHALGITRINVMSGLAGFYLLRDPANPIEQLLNPLTYGQYEIPIVIQDRSFNLDGTFFFPSLGINPTIHPYWMPEFFGDAIMVNGKTWPNLNVEPTTYRFRLLNGSNARFYNLYFSNKMAFTQIGSDGGYLPTPAPLTELLIAPGERADIIVDFSAIAPGTTIILRNNAKAPFPNGAPADPQTVGQIMQFTVVAGTLTTPLPVVLPPALNTILPLPAPTVPDRILTLNEVMGAGGPLEILLNGQKWAATISELPKVGTTEDWVIVNLTKDTHPIHLHLTQFQLVSRQPFQISKYLADWTAINGLPPLANPTQVLNPVPYLQGKPVGPAPNEMGWKDTIQASKGEVTRIRVRFAPIDGNPTYPFDPTTGPGYVWHCHILDHEDNEMMRPYKVQP